MADGRVFPFEYDQHDFDNGLRLISVPTPYREVVSVQIVVCAGSRNEVEPGRSGFAHFFEHMMFRGTPLYPPHRYEAALQAMGASSNAYTDDDRTVYHTTMTKEDLEPLLVMEADRFQNLAYTKEDFRTEALAVLGEYNKDSAEPINKLFEVLRDTAYDTHTYKHTTMGFLRDIERMPEMYDYSRLFFQRFYRPEFTVMVVAGDVQPLEVREAVGRHWGAWKPGNYACEVPMEGPAREERRERIDWKTPTLPYVLMAHRAPAYTDASMESAALDVIALLGFGENSPLYQRLVIDEQAVDMLWASNSDHVDPYLFTVLARIKEAGNVAEVEKSIRETLDQFATELIEELRLESVKSHLRYRFALGLNNSEAIAECLAHYVSLKRNPETINKLYGLYDRLTPETIREVARSVFTIPSRTTVTLSQNGDGL